ncbi:damage-control phosphatase ARMT1 family protein [Coraliomargarita sp. W4R53]
MNTMPDCYSCFLRQGLQAARSAGADEATQLEVTRAISAYLAAGLGEGSPVQFVREIQKIVARITGVSDPYLSVKASSNREALSLVRMIERDFNGSGDLKDYVRIAIAGNVIDYGPATRFGIEETLERCLTISLKVSHVAALEARLRNCRKLAYLADNAGEIVFDRLLLQFLLRRYGIEEVLFVVREDPFLNDALEADAQVAGITDLPGVTVARMNAGVPKFSEPGYEVWQAVVEADVRIAKGQANAEALDEQHDFFLLFMCKCELVARAFEAKAQVPLKLGDLVLLNTTPSNLEAS